MMHLLLRGVGRKNGDGWKDTTKKGEVVFVYRWTLPKPYAAGQHPRVGCIIWTATADQYDFAPASWLATVRLIPTMWQDYLAYRKFAAVHNWARSQIAAEEAAGRSGRAAAGAANLPEHSEGVSGARREAKP